MMTTKKNYVGHDETTSLVMTVAHNKEAHNKEDSTAATVNKGRKNKMIAVLLVSAAIVGIIFLVGLVGGGGDDRSGVVVLRNAATIDNTFAGTSTITTTASSELPECPKECQYTGTQDGDWKDVSGRECCLQRGIINEKCFLNDEGNTCTCGEGGFSDPCYIDHRCDPFHAMQDGKCKAKPDAKCDVDDDCMKGHHCGWYKKCFALPELQECPKECQYTGEREDGTLKVASGRLCCLNAGLKKDVCILNGNGNTCTCGEGGFSDPCYIDTQCDPFHFMKDRKCIDKDCVSAP